MNIRRIVAFALILTIVFGGVSAQDEKRVIRWAMSGEPAVLVDYVTTAGSAYIQNRIYALGTWSNDAAGNLQPLLVDVIPSEENSGVVHTDEGKTITTFTIADWAVWSDGTPITAADFTLVFDIMNDGVSNRDPNRFLEGLAVDSVAQGETAKDVVITFTETNPDVVNSAMVPLPNHILREQYEAALAEGQGFDTLTDWLRGPTVSNGPVVFDEWVSGNYIRYVRNENFWHDVWLDELLVSFYPDLTVIKQIMASGEADLTRNIRNPLDAIEFVTENPHLELTSYFNGVRQELYMNVGPGGHPALKDTRVRRAIVMALDRQSIADDLFSGYTKVARSYWDDTPWYNPDLPVIEYDPEGAIALLREAGWYDEDGDGVVEAHGVPDVEDGTPLTLVSYSFSDGWGGPYQASQLVVQDNLTEHGIDVQITLLPFAQIAAPYQEGGIRTTGAYDFILTGWGVGMDSVVQVEKWACSEIPGPDAPSGINYGFYCNEEVDALWNVLKGSLDEEARMSAVYRIQEILAEDNPTVQLVNLPTIWVVSGNLQNVIPWPGQQYIHNLHVWEISE